MRSSLTSKHPGVKTGPFEIRPANEEINRAAGGAAMAAIAKEG